MYVGMCVCRYGYAKRSGDFTEGSWGQSGRARERKSETAVQLDSRAGVQIRRTVGLNSYE